MILGKWKFPKWVVDFVLVIWNRNVIEQKMQTICMSFTKKALVQLLIHSVYYIQYRTLNNCKHHFNMKLPLGIERSVVESPTETREERRGTEQRANLHKHPAPLFSHESICLLTSSVWAQNTSNHREYIHIDITEVELLCRLLLLLFRIFIDINTRAFNRLKQRKRIAKKKQKKSYEVHREYQSLLRCNMTGSCFPFCTQFLMCFSVQNTSCLLFIFFSLFSFLLFSADFLSFVRVVVLNFLIFKHLHINSADNDEVIRCRFDICTWAHILLDIRVWLGTYRFLEIFHVFFLFFRSFALSAAHWNTYMCMMLIYANIRICSVIAVHMGISMIFPHRNTFHSESVCLFIYLMSTN